MTFSAETIISSAPIEQSESYNKFILTSIINPLCSFGLVTDNDIELVDGNEHNRKKIVKLEKELKLIIDKTSTKKYQKNAKAHTKERDSTKVLIYALLQIKH